MNLTSPTEDLEKGFRSQVGRSLLPFGSGPGQESLQEQAASNHEPGPSASGSAQGTVAPHLSSTPPANRVGERLAFGVS